MHLLKCAPGEAWSGPILAFDGEPVSNEDPEISGGAVEGGQMNSGDKTPNTDSSKDGSLVRSMGFFTMYFGTLKAK